MIFQMKATKWKVVLSNLLTACLCWVLFKDGSQPSGGSGQVDDHPGEKRAAESARTRQTSEEEKLANRERRLAQCAHYLAGNGGLSSSIMEDYKLTPAQFQALQSAMSVYWGEMAGSAAERIRRDDVASSKLGEGASVYRLAALPLAEQESMKVRLSKSLEAVGGNRLASDIIFSLEQNLAFGKMGSCDVTFELKPAVEVSRVDGQIVKTVNRNETAVECVYTRPGTAVEEVRITADSDYIRGPFGHLFGDSH